MSAGEPVFQVGDQGASTDEIHQRIRQIMTRYQLGHEADFARYTLNESLPNMPTEVRYALSELISTYDRSENEPLHARERISLLGRIKQPFRQLVVYYVKRAVGRQVAFNTAAVHAIYLLLLRDANRETEIAVLRQELASLRAQVNQILEPSDHPNDG